MKLFVYFMVLLLILLHQDYWWRADHTTLVMGFLPVSLAYHVALSLAASLVWGLACKYCWPADAEVADSDAWTAPPGGRGGH
ncbi:hypothetical protein RAS2_06150 [Phycisphaerae bacterium RAS2]|nr:hypothetical protein RAS2_06150 [Phycisphaerae bacterium RAS2]